MSFAVNFSPLPLRSPETTTGGNKFPKSFTRKRPMLSFAATNSTEAAQTTTPEIELEFIGPKAGGDGKYPVDRASAVSGEKLLRTIMADNKLELYGTYGKLMNCGGGGSCGTCIVEVVEGKELLNERTNTELKYLKKKPESWRLACQTIVGNKENSGKVVIQRLPQQKK
ncbi:putative 2Fe-2S ferredoxin-type iron-sulfur binding domain, Beta-grasp domain superfamily [Helianthus debilis subsp. tardiflorus]